MAKQSKTKKRKPKSEEQKKNKREKSSIRMQKTHRQKTLEQLAIGISNKRKYFESRGLVYISEEDGAEDFYSGSDPADDDISEIFSAPSYSGPPSADRLSSSSNDPVCRKMEIRARDTIKKVLMWIEQSIQADKDSAALDKAFQLTEAHNDAGTRRARAVFRKSQPASILIESGPALSFGRSVLAAR
jgi:hypothetical protein